MPWIGMPVDYTKLVPATYLVYGIFTYYNRCSITNVLTSKFLAGILGPASLIRIIPVKFPGLANFIIQHNPHSMKDH